MRTTLRLVCSDSICCIFVDYGKEETPSDNKEQQPPSNTTSSTASLTNTERPSKRARRTRNDTFSGLESNHNEGAAAEHVLRSQVVANPSSSTQKKTTNGKYKINFPDHFEVRQIFYLVSFLILLQSAGKKKKRKARQTNQTNQIEESDPNEPTYCLCDQISYGEMIMCDNDLCPIEWFHFSCVTLTTKPKGKWYCPKCRGDKPNVMKPKAQFLRELERYNKEKEEKT